MNDICFICSDGGHLVEIKRIFKILKDYNSFFVTFQTRHLGKSIETRKTYFLPRIKRNPIIFAMIFVMEFLILLKERPRIIISTGAGICIPSFILAKIFGIKNVYIETFARIKKPSLTGIIVYKLKPDLFFVQWEHHKKFFPKAIYGGSLF